MKRALIVKMWALGDILMATPLIAALRGTYPDIRITWVVDEAHGEILRGHPDIDDLVVIHSGEWRRMLRNVNLFGWLKRSSEIRREMAEQNFDIAINCHPDKWWTVIPCVAPVRVGLYPDRKQRWSRRFYTHVIQRPKDIHNTDHYLMATQALGIPDASKRMTMGETPDEKPFLTDLFARHHLSQDRPVVVIAPFSTGENRNWEPERYAAIANWLQTERNAQVLLTYSPRDSEKAKAITEQCRTPIVCAEGTSLRQYVALLRRADIALCVDSSAMHLAAALGTPYIALFGATPVHERAPLVGKGLPIAHIEGLTCAPCDQSHCSNPVFRACMKRITVEDVQKAIAELAIEPTETRGKISEVQECKVL